MVKMVCAIVFITCCGKWHFEDIKNWSNGCQQQQAEKVILLQREHQFILNKSQGLWPILGLYRSHKIWRWIKPERLWLWCGLGHEEWEGVEHKSHLWKGVWNEAGKTENGTDLSNVIAWQPLPQKSERPELPAGNSVRAKWNYKRQIAASRRRKN